MLKPDAIEFARKLRREMTPPEHRLWKVLKQRPFGYKWRRQVPRGPYTLDFACLELRLVIEIDGECHAERGEADVAREAWLRAHGFRVIRFWNREIMREWDEVLHAIDAVLRQY